MHFILRHPRILVDMALFALTSALGQSFIFLTVELFSPLTCSIVTTTRKFFTILASVLVFGHHLDARQWLGVACVIGGIVLDAMP